MSIVNYMIIIKAIVWTCQIVSLYPSVHLYPEMPYLFPSMSLHLSQPHLPQPVRQSDISLGGEVNR